MSFTLQDDLDVPSKSFTPSKFYMNLHIQGPIYNTKLYSDRVNKTNGKINQHEDDDLRIELDQDQMQQYKQKLRSLQNQSINERMQDVRSNSFSYKEAFTRYQDLDNMNTNSRKVQNHRQINHNQNLAETLLEVTDTRLPPGLSKKPIRDYKKKVKKEDFKVSNEDIYEAYKHHSLIFQQQKTQQHNLNINDQNSPKDKSVIERRKTHSVRTRPLTEHKGSVDFYTNYSIQRKYDKPVNSGVKLKPLQPISLNTSFNALKRITEVQDEQSANKNKIFLTSSSKQRNTQLLPLSKIFFLNRINKFNELKRNFMNFDISPFIFSNFKKEIQSSIDLQVLERAYPYIQKVLSTTFVNDFYATLSKNSEKKRDFDEMKLGNSKRDLMKLFDDFESEYISEKKLFERNIIFDKIRYREQIVIDLIGSINNLGENSLKNYQNIECLFDVNGKEVKDVLQLHFETLILLGGERETMKRNQFLRDLENFIEVQQNRQFRDTLKLKAQNNFETSQQISQSPFDSPKKNRSLSQISRSKAAQMKLFNESTYETKEAAGSSIHYENSINYPSFSHNITSPYSYPNKADSKQSLFGGNDTIVEKNSSNYKLSTILQEGSIDMRNRQMMNNGIGGYIKRKQLKSNVEYSKMKTKELVRIRNIYPQLANKDIFRYYSEFQSLVNLNEGFEATQNILEKIPKHEDLIYAMNFFTFCTSYKNSTHTPIINSILRAIGIDVEVVDRSLIKLSWDKFLNLRVLMEQKGEKSQIVDFLQRLFDPKRIGIISKHEFLEILQTSEKLVSENGEEAKIYAHQMWNYFNKNNFMNEYVELRLSQIEEKYEEHRYSYIYFLNWILNNFDESSELEIDNS